MLQSNQPPYPEELSKFLTAQAAQLDVRKHEGVPLMPLEFQLMYPRQVRWSGWFPQPDGSMAHWIGARDASPEQELWHRINDPERGLHPDDLLAYRESKRGPVSRFFARLKFWPSKKSKTLDEWEIPHFLRKQSD
jgi:hypothetical protein